VVLPDFIIVLCDYFSSSSLNKKHKDSDKKKAIYTEVFSPVARHETIMLVIAVETIKACTLYHLDVK